MQQWSLWTLFLICGRVRNFKDINEKITFGNVHTMVVTKLGDLKCEVTQVNGSKFEVSFKEVKYFP
jgi:hypothetical protein